MRTAERPKKLGNVPRLGGYVAWHYETLGRYVERGHRARVVECGPEELGVEHGPDGPVTYVKYDDVYPCEPPS